IRGECKSEVLNSATKARYTDDGRVIRTASRSTDHVRKVSLTRDALSFHIVAIHHRGFSRNEKAMDDGSCYHTARRNDPKISSLRCVTITQSSYRRSDDILWPVGSTR